MSKENNQEIVGDSIKLQTIKDIMALLPVERNPHISTILFYVINDICDDKSSRHSSQMGFGKFLKNHFCENHPIWNWVEVFTPEPDEDFEVIDD